MNIKKLLGISLVATAATVGSIAAEVKPAEAFTVHDGWNYSMDAHNDSTPFKRDGSGLFEIRGTAWKVIGDQVVFAINSNIPNVEDGVEWTSGSAARDDSRIDFSDVLINFTGESLDQANGDLYGIHFAKNNDSGVSELGIYKNVTAQSVASMNSGWGSLNSYNNYLDGKNIMPSIGDLATDDSYFDLESSPVNSIVSGTKIGDIEFLTDLSGLGLDFDYFGNAGSSLAAFAFDKGLLPSGTALYHLAMECNNDIVGGHFEFDPDNSDVVPTPAALLPALLGMFGAASRKKNEEELA